MPDFPASRSSHETGLSDTERREVVVEHEPLLEGRVLDALLPLSIDFGTERRRDQSLRLAASEDRRTVGSG